MLDSELNPWTSTIGCPPNGRCCICERQSRSFKTALFILKIASAPWQRGAGQDVPERIPARSFPNWMRPGSNLRSILLSWRIITLSHRLATGIIPHIPSYEVGFIQIIKQLRSGIVLQVVGVVGKLKGKPWKTTKIHGEKQAKSIVKSSCSL